MSGIVTRMKVRSGEAPSDAEARSSFGVEPAERAGDRDEHERHAERGVGQHVAEQSVPARCHWRNEM